MADSGVTKKSLASALKDLTAGMPFAKISIGDICKQCDMSRKTFYYHFKDKEDLVNWIFDTEFIEPARHNTYESVWEAIEELMRYFYQNRVFYKKILQQEGRNSFTFHFNELIYAVFVDQLQTILKNPHARDFQINFIADGMIGMLKRWLTSSECVPPDEFIGEIQSGAQIMAKYIFRTLSDGTPDEPITT